MTFDADFADAAVAPRLPHVRGSAGGHVLDDEVSSAAVAGLNVVGADVNVCPQYEPAGGPTQLALATVAFWETALLAAARN